MTAFVIGVALLIVLAGCMLWPARRGSAVAAGTGGAHLGILGEQLAALDREHAAGQLDDAQYRAARAEWQRRVLDETPADDGGVPATVPAAASRRTPIAVGIGIPVFALALYFAIGNFAALSARPGADTPAAAQGDVSPEAVQAMLERLAQRLEKSSGNTATDLQGWTMLGRSYAVLQRFAEADRAFARALAIAPKDAQLLADRADVLAMLQGQRTAGEPDRLIAQALQIDPSNLKALALAGSAAFERKDVAAARDYWQKARAIAPAGSEFAGALDRSLSELGSAGGDAAGTKVAAATSANNATPASAGASSAAASRISGRVSLAPALAARAAPTDTVFIFARAAEGPRMPLAILRRTVAELPFTFTLDDTLAMSPQMKLSAFDRVIVGARISRSGNAMPQPGDLRGESAPVGNRKGDLQLVIDGVQP